ncbi:unnamed protein product [Clonostachys rosea]|uniref:phospholipase A2 n=1 Tax=Bionectria ochroleuca TaxID=29856 RepID=A0ABY6U8P7_BIOOC|nr:unnamed protein product [Clonostachys rosea]
MSSRNGHKRSLEIEEPPPLEAKRSRPSPSGHDDGFRHEDYTVGWICALPIELAAAKSMLDQVHKPLPPLPDDSNTYTLGNIGLHNIVLACLPLDYYGTNNAAIVAANMCRTYPSIDKRFMVGIGGGLPTTSNDVRLGDIVVGTEVIQFDFGKQISLNNFKRTAMPTRPPQLLLTAVSSLKAIHEAKQTRVPSLLSDMIRRHPAMCGYSRPDRPDHLFRSTYIHGSRDSCDYCDPSQEMIRDARVNATPLIHYGKVGSANMVVKDSKTRDRLSEELGILCVEMEAAGLMDGFPCLVIRGICDYADSHKSKQWQRYSAATAAAYAKELLLEIPGNQIRTSPTGAPAAKKGLCVLEMEAISILTQTEEKMRERVLKSLGFHQIESRHTNIKAAYEKTCQWLYYNPNYHSWLDPNQLSQHHGFLWIIGKPGAGKSTLMKFAYNHTTESSRDLAGSAIVAFFFNARGEVLEKTTVGMYRSLLSQIFQHFPELAYILDKFTSKSQRHSVTFEWTVETMQTILSEIVGELDTRSLILFIDALDECDPEEIRDMVEYFEELGSKAFQNNTKLRICFSSRPYPHIDIQNRIRFTLEEQTEHSEDLAKYVRGKLRAGDSKLATWVYEEILRKSAGIFMWVVLAVDILNGVFRNGQLLQVQRRLRELPPKLSDLFKDILCRDEENMDDMLLCIQWIAFATRPLRCAEFYFALAAGLLPTDTAMVKWDSEVITPEVMKRYVLSSSKGLAEVTRYRETETVNFIHESVRDFFIKDNGIQSIWPHLAENFEIHSHERLRQCCYAYVAHGKDIPKNIPSSQYERLIQNRHVLSTFPFLEYASKYLFHHSNRAATLVSQTTFLKDLDIRSWVHQFNLFQTGEYHCLSPSANLMDIVAKLGCPKLAKLMCAWDSGYSAFRLSSDHTTYPLFTAIRAGNIDVVHIFLAEEAKVPSEEITKLHQKLSSPRHNDMSATPLHWAASIGNLNLFRYILAISGPEIGSQNADGLTPLSIAAANGHEDILQLLLGQPSVVVNSQDLLGRTALWQACGNGHKNVVKLLLVIGNADINKEDSKGRSPLSKAVENGHLAVPRVLCLDGGGIRGLSEILVLKELMLQVRIHNGLDYTPEPNQCFDFICGTSTGGLVAVLLGRLGKTLDECEELFRKLGSEIFESSSFLKSSRLILKGSKHTGESLAEAIRAQAGDGLMYDEDCPSSGHVPVAVVAVSKTTVNDYLFRTYGARANTEACPIVDACRATSAATTFFPSIMINGVEYVDGAFGKNNPSGVALSELESSEWLAPMQDAVNGVACFVSIGTGRPTIKIQKSGLVSTFMPGASEAIKAAKSCRRIATDCHNAHLEVANRYVDGLFYLMDLVEKANNKVHRFKKAGANELYYRFDVDRGLESVALNESSKEALQHISAVTKGYLGEHSTEIQKCARLIAPMSRLQSLQLTVFSGLPEKSPYFYGRDEELQQVRNGLDPSKPGRKAVLLYGIGGSGKTQLVLQHIEQHRADYTAVIWINASNKENAVRSFEEASLMIAAQWPADLPLPSSGSSNALSHVRWRLLNTRYRRWLLVLDSLDDLDHHFAEYIPSCTFGSVIVTSTAFRSCFGFRPEKPINVEGLSTASSLSLLYVTSKHTSSDEEGKSIQL